jgi:hypothetical protein
MELAVKFMSLIFNASKTNTSLFRHFFASNATLNVQSAKINQFAHNAFRNFI